MKVLEIPIPNPVASSPWQAAGELGRMCRTRLDSDAACVSGHTPRHDGVQQSGQSEGSRDWLEDAGAGSLQATDWEAGASGRDAPSLPLSAASRCPGGINTRFLPLISSRGAGGRTERQK